MRLMILVLALAGAMAVQAKGKDDGVAIPAVSSSTFAAQRDAIVAGFENGEKYAEITGKQRSDVLAALDRMEEAFGNAATVDALSPEAKVNLYNDQELVNTILTDAQEQSRIKCRRSRGVNSRMPVNECHTIAEWQRIRERSQDYVDQNVRTLTTRGN